MKIGIEAIAFDTTTHYLEMADLARARGVEPDKFLKGLGQKQMSVAAPCEDTVTLAAGAGKRLIENFGIDPESIALLITGTETAVDHSKPVSSYVHQLLGLSERCRVFEVKHACYGAMIGISTAVNYIMSGKAKGRKALVIATDIARYGKDTAGEPTQGAGAVAMLISDNPQLLEIDYQKEGFFAKQVMDFWRPLYSKEAFADGHYSINCYLEALTGAYGMYQESCEEPGARHFSERFSACLYHVPFVKMALKAHHRLTEIDNGFSFDKEASQWKNMLQDYESRVAPSLEFNARIGNIYTGALFLSLAHLLEHSSDKLAGESISLFSYGSGCGAEFISGRVAEQAHEIMQQHSSAAILDERKRVTIPEYETMLEACGKMDVNNSHEVCDPQRWNVTKPFLYTGTVNHQRLYITAEQKASEGLSVNPLTLN